MVKAVPSGSDTSQQGAGVSPSKVGALRERQLAEHPWELPWSHPRAALEGPVWCMALGFVLKWQSRECGFTRSWEPSAVCQPAYCSIHSVYVF